MRHLKRLSNSDKLVDKTVVTFSSSNFFLFFGLTAAQVCFNLATAVWSSPEMMAKSEL